MKHSITRDWLARELGIHCLEMEAAGFIEPKWISQRLVLPVYHSISLPSVSVTRIKTSRTDYSWMLCMTTRREIGDIMLAQL
jgi:hypothetical protein